MHSESRGGGEEPGRVKGGEIIIRIECMRKESIFNKRNKRRRNEKKQSELWGHGKGKERLPPGIL